MIQQPQTDTAARPGTRVVLVNPYELGRQPFGLAQPAAWLERAGFDVRCIDLAVETLDPEILADARLVAVHLPMHTATRIAVETLPRIRSLAPAATIAAYGLYAPGNAALLGGLGVTVILGGEIERALTSVAEALRDGTPVPAREPPVHLDRIEMLAPARAHLPGLEHYASLLLPDGTERRMGFTESTRGCKHLCRHCPVVPVYEGRFFAVPREVVLADISAQVAGGAEHVSFGDPDFLNGPTHALRIAEALHAAHPALTWDATIKVEHLVKHADLLPRLAEAGCVLVVSAFESVDEMVLDRLAKGHSGPELDLGLAALARAGIAVSPTFVPVTPWTTLEGYLELLVWLVERRLIESVPPVQLALRLLIPAGSYLLHLDEVTALAGPYDPDRLGHAWDHPDPRVDALQETIQTIAERADAEGLTRRDAFALIWEAAHHALGRMAPELPAVLGEPVPRHSEGWYCCAEPTARQLGAGNAVESESMLAGGEPPAELGV